MKYDVRKILFGCRLGITLAILAIIFSRIDLMRVLACLGRVRVSWALLSLMVGYVAPVLIMVWRWQIALRVLYGIEAPYRLLLRHYWTGTFVGYFVPGGLGIDIYRAAAMRGAPGGFKLNAAAIVGERVFSVIATAFLLIASYPPVSGRLVSEPELTRIVRFIYILGVVALATLGIIVVLNSALGARLRQLVQRRMGREISRVTHQVDQRSTFAEGKADSWELVNSFFNWKSQLVIMGLSVLNQVVASVGGRFLLLSIDVNLPLLTHIFSWTLMYFFFLLPISIGGFGIREASFIIIFGLFGVSRENALASSFISLASGLVTVGIGGVFWLKSGSKGGRSAAGGV